MNGSVVDSGMSTATGWVLFCFLLNISPIPFMKRIVDIGVVIAGDVVAIKQTEQFCCVKFNALKKQCAQNILIKPLWYIFRMIQTFWFLFKYETAEINLIPFPIGKCLTIWLLTWLRPGLIDILLPPLSPQKAAQQVKRIHNSYIYIKTCLPKRIFIFPILLFHLPLKTRFCLSH